MASSGPAPLHGRHRDKNGQASKKHGNTLTGMLRKTYETHFAQGCGDHEKLSDVLHRLDEVSLRQLVLDPPHAASPTEAG
jgi:hypothetical protein